MRIVGNVAMSLDGRIARAGGVRARLSSPEDKARVHRQRHDVDAILVGAGTVLADDPELLVDPSLAGVAEPRHPLRVVLDGRLRTPPTARVLRGPAKTLVFTRTGNARALPGAEVLPGGAARVELKEVVTALRERGVRSLLVEGGAQVHGRFLAEDRYDAFTAYVAPTLLGEGPSLAAGIAASFPLGPAEPRLRFTGAQAMGEGTLLAYARP